MMVNTNKYHRLLTRPVVVISTISKKGISNAAPFSFNSPISFNPPLYGFSCMPRHHTWKNIKESKEFVVNIIGKSFGPLMHILEHKFPYEISEIEKAGLTELPSKFVKPLRIKEAIGWIECKLEESKLIGDHRWIVGKVLGIEVKEEFWKEVLNVEKVNPLFHISGKFFATDAKSKEYKRD